MRERGGDDVGAAFEGADAGGEVGGCLERGLGEGEGDVF